MPNADDWGRNFDRAPFWTTTKAVLATLAIVALLIPVIGLLTTGSALFQGEVDKAANPGREKSILFQPNNSIGSYAEFFRLCQGVRSDNESIAALQTDVKDRQAMYDKDADPFGNESKAISELRSDVTGLRSHQAELAADYNAKSAATTSAQFKSADLPYTLEAPYSDVECGNSQAGGR